MSENSNLQNQDKVEAFLPPVELIQKYEELGIGKDLVELVRDEQEHRHNIQKKYIMCYMLGQIASLILAIGVFFGVYKFMMNGMVKHAYIVLGIYVVLFIFAFIKARKDRIRNIANNSKKKISSPIINRSKQKRYNSGYSGSHGSRPIHGGHGSYSK